MHLRPRWAGILLVAPLAVATASCADDHPFDTSSLAAVTLDLADFRISGPPTIPAGGVQLTANNNGAELHQAVFAKLNDGVSAAEYAAGLEADINSGLGEATYFGGAQTVVAGASQTVEIELDPGSYAMFCLLPSPSDGISHLAKGMISEVTVTGPDPDIEAEALLPPPTNEAEIDLINWAFQAPDDLTVGDSYRVLNAGTQVHELVLARIADGSTAEQALAFLQDPPAGAVPPYLEVAGLGEVSPDKQGRITITASPGNYALICFMPDPTDGVAHFLKGMFKPVTLT